MFGLDEWFMRRIRTVGDVGAWHASLGYPTDETTVSIPLYALVEATPGEVQAAEVVEMQAERRVGI